ncbi:MAG: septum formation initiator family protein [Actinomycetota bacterium]|nr:septum formation initiator family protein [Actinomycetota bacterium]
MLPLAVVAICVILAWQFYPVMRVQYREAREKSRLEAQLSALKARNTKLRAQVDRLKTPEGVEEIARESLGLVKQGEHAVVIVDASREPTDPVTKAPEPAVETTDAPGPAGPFTPLLDAIFGVTN